MTWLPVVAREMLINARRRRTYVNRTLTALVALIASSIFLFSASNTPMAQKGQLIFSTLSTVTFCFALLAGVGTTADCLSEEKREGTLGLLFLTDLRGYDVVAGKMAASSLQAVYTVVGIFPLLALALLFGGITLGQIGATSLILLSTIFVSLSVGVLISALSRLERKARFATACVLLLISLGPFTIAYQFHLDLDEAAASLFLDASPLGFLKHFLQLLLRWVSPVYPLWLVHHLKPGRGLPLEIFFSVACQGLSAWILLVIASRIVPGTAHERLAGVKRTKLNDLATRWTYGAGANRTRFRGKLLDENPFLWLAGREKVKPKYAWGVVIFFGLLWAWIYGQYIHTGFDLPILIGVLIVTHSVFQVWTASEISNRMVEDRKSGALELLLSSPLSVREVAAGQSLALQRLFRWPILALLGIEILCITSLGHTHRQASPVLLLNIAAACAVSLVINLWAIKWVCMWRCLFDRTVGRVLVRTLVVNLLLPWILLAGTYLAASVTAQVTGRPAELSNSQAVWSWSCYCLGVSLLLGLPARAHVLRCFRETASQRFDGVQKIPNSFILFLRESLALIPRDAKTGQQPWLLRKRSLQMLAGTALLLVMTGFWIRKTYWQHQVAQRLALIRKQGFPAGEENIFELNPPIPQSEDAAALLIPIAPSTFASSYSSRHAFISSRAELERNTEQLRLLHRLPDFKKYHIDFQSRDPSEHLSLLETEAMIGVEDHDKALLSQAISSLLAFFRLMKDQPFEEALPIRDLTLRIVGKILSRIYSSDLYSAQEWNDLTASLESLMAPNSLRDLLAVKRAIILNSFSRINQLILPALGADPRQFFFAGVYGFNTWTGARDKTLASFLDTFETYMQAVQKPLEERWKAHQMLEAPPDPTRPGFSYLKLSHMLQGPYDNFMPSIVSETYLRILVKASRLAATGNFEPGQDPFATNAPAAPLIYKPRPNGFRLYSVGPNQSDDGGDVNGYPPRDLGVRFEKPK